MSYWIPKKLKRRRREVVLHKLRVAALAVGVVYWAGTVSAAEVDELAADQLSVRELMRLETEHAIKRLRTEKAESGTRASGHRFGPSTSAKPSAASLVAIYGVGSKLMAQVLVDDETLLFMRGRSQAVGPGKSHRLRLVDITERCVELALGEERESLCAPAQAMPRN